MKTIKLLKVIILVLILSITCVCFCSCDNNITTKDVSINKDLDLLNNNSINNSINNDESKAPDTLELDSTEDLDEHKIYKKNIIGKEDSFKKYGFEFTNFSFKKSKQLPSNIEVKDFIYFLSPNNSNVLDGYDYIDEGGSLLNKTSYFFFSMDVTNSNNKEMRLCWNNIMPFLIEDKGKYYYNASIENEITSWEARYRSSNVKTKDLKNYFIDNISPDETISIVIGYIIDDKYLNDKRMCIVPEACITTLELDYNHMKCIGINR